MPLLKIIFELFHAHQHFPRFGSFFRIDSNKNAHMRYFSGKTFEKLQEDNQLTTDGKYVTWQTVAGAARSTDMNVIQSDFYEYINSIATRSDFRTQYNSWYDNMMTINDDNIESAFKKMEKGFSESGVETDGFVCCG